MTESKSTRKPNADGVRTLPASVSLPESLIRIAERISARGCRLFAVGGLVRCSENSAVPKLLSREGVR